jgi:hypothetical protein
MPDKYVKNPVIDIYSIEQQIEGCLNDFFKKIDPELNYKDLVKIKTTTFIDGLYYCYENLFKPEDKREYNRKTNINTDDIPLLQTIANKYLSLCNYYNKHCGVYGFSMLTGIGKDVLIRWCENSTCLQYEIVKNIKDNTRDSFENSLQDSDLGRMAIANNSQTMGLNYGYQAAAQQAAAAAPRLESIAERYGKPPQITGGA